MMPIFRLPKLKGETDRDRLGELYRYVYQLVNDIQMAFATLSQGDGNALGTGIGKKDVDGIIDVGVRHGWTYRRYKGGAFEMFGNFNVTASSSGTYTGGMYLSEVFSLPAPFATEALCISGCAECAYITEGDGRGISVRLMSPVAFTVDKKISLSLHVCGKYTNIQEENING